MSRLPILSALILATACHSAGLYGHAQSYEPLSDEATAAADAKEYDPVMAKRQPEEWKNKPVKLFGVVVSRQEGPGGAADLKLSVRTLEPRNLCESTDEDSCRVTVSDHEHAMVHALVKLQGEDDIGKLSVGASSLLRIVGVIRDDVDPNDGTPVMQVEYYRHWPRGYFVTTKDRATMRR
jgi:hypothetical protein